MRTRDDIEITEETEKTARTPRRENLKNGRMSRSDKVRIAAFAAGVAIAAASAIGLVGTFARYAQTKATYAEAEEEFFSEDPSATLKRQGKKEKKLTKDLQVVGDVFGGAAQDTPQKGWWSSAFADVESMKEKYPGVIGWIYFEGEEISYPIMWASNDNDAYIRTDYKGNSKRSGSIFLDGAGSPNFQDALSVIYGHNMKDLSMFGKLKYYKTKKDYYDGHEYFQIFVPGAVYRYQVFAYGDISASAPLYSEDSMGSNSVEVLENRVEDLERASLVSSDFSPRSDDHVVVLSTCSSSSDLRFVVSAARISTHRFEQSDTF